MYIDIPVKSLRFVSNGFAFLAHEEHCDELVFY